MILPILQIGDEILKKKSAPVTEYNDELKKLLDDMKQTLADAKGAGLAAPQVGRNIRAFIVDTDDGYYEFINPVILGTSGSQYGVEGCLSVKGKWGDVKRPRKVTVEAFDRNGKKFKVVARDFFARAVCHENDHLDGLPTFQFEKIRLEGAETLKSLNADIMVTCAYGQLLSQEIIDICKFGIINVHASLLPRYRGAAPIQYAVINGESKTGVTFMKTAAGLDTGDIIAEYEIPIGEDETAGELAARLSALGAEHICDILTAIENGSATFTPQNEQLAFTVKTIKKEQAETDFSLPAVKVKQFILGMNPAPVAYAFCNGKKIKIYRAKALNEEFAGKCGEVVKADKKLIVKCGSGAIEITEIQEEGGKKLSARDFTAGRKLAVGDVLGKNV